jgi:Tol biopolymer transport system component
MILLALFFTAQRASAALQNNKLSGDIPDFGDVHEDTDFAPRLSPDGRYVLFMADVLADDWYQLFSVPIDGSSDRIPLTSPITDLGEFEFAITPDSSTVVYRLDEGSADVYELFKVPIDGSAMKTKMSGVMVAGGDVEKGFQITPDGQNVLFVADKEVDQVSELFFSPITGNPVKKLSGDLVPGGDLDAYFQIAPDSSKVVFLADKNVDSVYQLFSVPISAGELPLTISSGSVLGGDVRAGFKITPDSSLVVFRGDRVTNDMEDLFSVSINGGLPPIRLNGPMVADGDVQSGFQLSPDGSRVVFMADAGVDNLFELYSVEVDDNVTLVRLNDNLVAGGDVQTFRISPDNSRVVFLADLQTDDDLELYSVPLADGPNTRLNRDLVAGGDVFFDFVITPDSKKVIYRADQAVDQFNELYSVPLPGGDVTKINKLTLASGISGFTVNPDSFRVIFRARENAGVDELFQGSIIGEVPMKLNGGLVAGGAVMSEGYQISPDGSRVLYLADQDKDEHIELFVTYEALPVVEFAQEGLTKPENSGGFDIEVALNTPFSAPVTVEYAISGGSGSGDDVMIGGTGKMLFEPGVTAQNIHIQIVDDALPEGDETVIVEISNPQNGTIGAVSSFTLTIADDDGGEGPVYSLQLPVVISN